MFTETLLTVILLAYATPVILAYRQPHRNRGLAVARLGWFLLTTTAAWIFEVAVRRHQVARDAVSLYLATSLLWLMLIGPGWWLARGCAILIRKLRRT